MLFQENIAIYVQIAGDIKEQIISGRLHEGDRIGSVREYSLHYAVTALTIQRTMALLESEGVIHTKKGVGSFVSDGAKEALRSRMLGTAVRDFLTHMKNMGIQPEEIISLIKEGLCSE